MKILIYGGSGYLGSSLTQYLNSDHKISIISRSFKKKNNYLKGIKYLNLKQNKNIISNIKDSDIIIISNGPSNQKSKKEIFDYTYYFNNEICNIKKHKKKSARLIYFSSIHVYEKKIKKQIVTNDILNSKSHYGIRNILCENIILREFQSDEGKFNIIRISNVFGILKKSKFNLKDNMFNLALNQFCIKAILGKKIYIHSSSLQKRNYVSINDFVIFIKLIIEKKYKLPNIINYNSDKVYSLKNISQIIKSQSKILGIKIPKFIFLNKIKNSQINYIFDNKLLSSFNLKPKIKIEKEILNTLTELNRLKKNENRN